MSSSVNRPCLARCKRFRKGISSACRICSSRMMTSVNRFHISLPSTSSSFLSLGCRQSRTMIHYSKGLGLSDRSHFPWFLRRIILPILHRPSDLRCFPPMEIQNVQGIKTTSPSLNISTHPYTLLLPLFHLPSTLSSLLPSS
jgi:hypothetical protein